VITNHYKAKLKAGGRVQGMFIDVASPNLVEMAGLVGFDFVIIDAEHTSASVETVEHMVRAADSRNTGTVVRVALNLQQNVLRYLDTGVQGVILPQIESPEAAVAAVNSVKYPPLGRRGSSYIRPADYGINTTLAEYARVANEETLVAVQVETAEGTRNLERILEVEGIDVIFFGPGDLSVSLGYPSTTHPELIDTIIKMAQKVIAAGKIAGTTAHTPEAHRRWTDAGFRFLATVFSLQYLPAVKAFVAATKAID
jgi:4-hydroxy-2-oxoheptanedioate aldolase